MTVLKPHPADSRTLVPGRKIGLTPPGHRFLEAVVDLFRRPAADQILDAFDGTDSLAACDLLEARALPAVASGQSGIFFSLQCLPVDSHDTHPRCFSPVGIIEDLRKTCQGRLE